MYCQRCQIEYPEGKKFCRQCGGQLKPKATILPGEASNCPNCGKSVVPSAKFCGGCGISLVGPTPVSFARVQTTAQPTSKQIDAAALEEAIRQQRKKVLKAAGIGIGGLGLLGVIIAGGFFAYRAFVTPPSSTPEETPKQVAQGGKEKFLSLPEGVKTNSEGDPKKEETSVNVPSPSIEGEEEREPERETFKEPVEKGTVSPPSTKAGVETPISSLSSEEVGPQTVWNPPDEKWEAIHKSCPSEPGRNYIGCITSGMRNAGASSEAIAFTERMKGEVYLGSFREMGKVDLAEVVAPLFNDPNVVDYLLVNGVPNTVQLWDHARSVNIRNDPLYSSLLKKFPKLEIWPMHDFDTMQRLSDGGQRFIFRFMLLEGCRACSLAGSAKVAFDFNGQGRFAGATLAGLVSVTQDAQFYYERGLTHYNNGQYDQAVAEYHKALIRNPDSAQYSYSRGLAYSKKGHHDDAIGDFRVACGKGYRDACKEARALELQYPTLRGSADSSSPPTVTPGATSREENQKRTSGLTVSPGWYEVVRSTPLLEEPHRDAAIITRLPLKKRVYVVSATGDYVRVESTRGKPPGYISRKDLVPARGGKEAVRLEEQSRREEERQQRLQAQEEAGRQAEVARQVEIQRREEERRQQQEWQQQQELLRSGERILRGLPR